MCIRSLENGTTYNSYIICGDKTALVDASHEKFHNLYLETLQKELDRLGECTAMGASSREHWLMSSAQSMENYKASVSEQRLCAIADLSVKDRAAAQVTPAIFEYWSSSASPQGHCFPHNLAACLKILSALHALP